MQISSTLKPRLNSKLILGFALAVAANLWAGPAVRLRSERSPFLRSYADTLVDWQPWTDATFARAKRENKPVFVAVGVFTNELSRAMASQTFSNEKAAALLNGTFVCVLLDREEHPDLAAQYLAYVRTVKQLDGWPLNIWLTPELKPYEGATYLPPSEEWGKPSFAKVAERAKEAWSSDPAGCRTRADQAMAQLAGDLPKLSASTPTTTEIASRLDGAAAAWRTTYDAEHPGFGDPPRNPEPELLRFLLRREPAARDIALADLAAVANSALRDPLDGGFFHAAEDPAWHVPSRQKLLSDQARIALAYLDAAKTSETPLYAQVARSTLDYAIGRLQLADGTFVAVEDATDAVHAPFYAWTTAEIETSLGPDAAEFIRLHGAAPAGNIPADFDPSGEWRGKNILWSNPAADAKNGAAISRLRLARDRRPAPARDERATAGAHGLLLAALSRAGEQLRDRRYLDAAARLFEAGKKHLVMDDRNIRHFRGSTAAGTAADYAAFAWGCREYAKAAHRDDAENLARHLLARTDELYFDAASGHYFNTAVPPPAGLWTRVPTLAETPSAEALALTMTDPVSASAIRRMFCEQISQPDPPVSGDLLLSLRDSGR